MLKERAAVAGLLGLMAIELLFGVWSDGLTIDELVYIGSGYRHLTAGDYRPTPETPPLSKLLSALPLLTLHPSVPEVRPGDNDWSWSYRFVHVANDPNQVIGGARLADIALTLGLALLLWGWGREVGGASVGLAALVLAAFHPSILAHGHLVATDLPCALAMAAASWAFWRWSCRPTAPRALLVALLTGATVMTRLPGWLLLPSFAVLLALGRRQPEPAKPTGRQILALAAAIAVIVPLVIWAVYGFRYGAWPGAVVAQPPGPWLGRAGRVIESLERARVLPEAYLEGVRFQVEHNAIGHPTYLLGRMSATGWPHYYLVAFLTKNTPGFLLAVGAALATLWPRRKELLRGSVEAHWLVTAGALFALVSFGRVQIGERYLVPAYPYLILLAASWAARVCTGRRGGFVITLLAMLHVVPSLLAAPGGYLAYFNLIAGGTAGADRVLLDSNLDWGQDLPRLAAWMKQNAVERVQLGYHGSDDPGRYKIDFEDLSGLFLYPTRPAKRPFHGTVAVAPSLLHGIFSPPGQNPYARLLARPPDDRAGVFFIYRLGDEDEPPAAR